MITTRDPFEQSFIWPERAQPNVTWDGWQPPRYIESVRSAPEQVTLGNLAATLQEILQRTEAEHDGLSQVRSLSRDFGEQVYMGVKSAEDEWPGMLDWLRRDQRVVPSYETDGLSEELAMAIAVSMSLEQP